METPALPEGGKNLYIIHFCLLNDGLLPESFQDDITGEESQSEGDITTIGINNLTCQRLLSITQIYYISKSSLIFIVISR